MSNFKNKEIININKCMEDMQFVCDLNPMETIPFIPVFKINNYLSWLMFCIDAKDPYKYVAFVVKNVDLSLVIQDKLSLRQIYNKAVSQFYYMTTSDFSSFQFKEIKEMMDGYYPLEGVFLELDEYESEMVNHAFGTYFEYGVTLRVEKNNHEFVESDAVNTRFLRDHMIAELELEDSSWVNRSIMNLIIKVMKPIMIQNKVESIVGVEYLRKEWDSSESRGTSKKGEDYGKFIYQSF